MRAQNTHEKVKKRIAQLVKEWTNDFERDESLGIMAETYEYLQNKGALASPSIADAK